MLQHFPPMVSLPFDKLRVSGPNPAQGEPVEPLPAYNHAVTSSAGARTEAEGRDG